MLIAVVCPRCETQYQVDAGLRGKRMRCPNAICRHVFEVPIQEIATSPEAPPAPKTPLPPPVAKAPPPPTPTTRPAPQRKPVVKPPVEKPVVQKPPVEKPPVEKPTDWSAIAPPPVRSSTVEVATPSTPDVDIAEFPGDFPEDDASPVEDTVTAPAPAPIEPVPMHPRRRSLWIITVMLLVLVLAAGAGWWRWQAGLAEREQALADAAAKAYQEQDYQTAAQRYQQLVRDYGGSEHAKKYRFLAEFSDVRADVYRPQDNVEELYASLRRVLEFLTVYQADPLLKTQQSEVWQTLHDLADVLLGQAETKELAEPLSLAQHAWREAKKQPAPAGKDVSEIERNFTSRFEALSKSLDAKEQRRQLLAQLDAWRDDPSIDRVLRAKQAVSTGAHAKDADVQAKLQALVGAHRSKILFVPNPSPPAPVATNEDPYPSLALAPALGKTRPIAVSHEPVLALARGVLYAFDPVEGELRWVKRLGIDTTRLPIRLPADDLSPARLLLFSSDQQTLTAVEEATGKPLWTHALTGVCLGTPVLVDHHLLAATQSGRIEEIDLRGGRMHGWYQLDQPLPLGGVRMPGTSRVYFPGDKECLYEIDVAARACTAIHYTGHGSGTLAGAPLPLADPDDPARGYLLWSQAKGPSSIEMQPYELPGWQPVELKLTARGWSDLGLYDNPDQVALATDSGLLSMWGRKQKGNSDPLLFPRVLDQRLASPTVGSLHKSLVAHTAGDRLWVVALGKLHLLQRDLTAQPTARIEPRWGSPPTIGSPLHAAQIRHQADGKMVLFLATQDTDSPRCRLSAVDAETGEMYWQRQLGLIADQDGVTLAKDVLLPSGDETFAIARKDMLAGAPWRFPRTAALIEETPHRAQAFHVEGEKVLHLSWPTTTRAVRELHWRELGEKSAMQSANLADIPQGPPVVGATCMIVPLRNGELLRIALSQGTATPGPDWRAPGAEEHPALSAHVGGDRFVVADGRGGLVLFDASNAKAWERKGSAALPFRIVAAPLALAGDMLRVVIVDAADTLTLLEGDRLLKRRSWALGGKLSAGPFRIDRLIGCVLAGKRLIVLDPDSEEPRWETSFAADVVGVPSRLGDALVVADSAGSIHFFDPDKGESARPSITLKANAAPTIAPLPLDASRLLVPLTDGTMMIVAPEK